jgi:hypothetical protein
LPAGFLSGKLAGFGTFTFWQACSARNIHVFSTPAILRRTNHGGPWVALKWRECCCDRSSSVRHPPVFISTQSSINGVYFTLALIRGHHGSATRLQYTTPQFHLWVLRREAQNRRHLLNGATGHSQQTVSAIVHAARAGRKERINESGSGSVRKYARFQTDTKYVRILRLGKVAALWRTTSLPMTIGLRTGDTLNPGRMSHESIPWQGRSAAEQNFPDRPRGHEQQRGIVMSGHSKWATIKHKKAATDLQNVDASSRVIREITIAAHRRR